MWFFVVFCLVGFFLGLGGFLLLFSYSWFSWFGTGWRLWSLGTFGGILHHLPAEPQLGQESGDCLRQRGQGLGAQGWCFPAGSTSSFPTERLEKGFVKDVASSEWEQDIHRQVAGCRQGCAGTVVADGPLAQGGQRCPQGTRPSRGSSNHPAGFGVVRVSEPAALPQPMGVMSAARSQPTHSHHCMAGCDPGPPGAIWRLGNPPQKPQPLSTGSRGKGHPLPVPHHPG